jgi:hypothetical protein
MWVKLGSDPTPRSGIINTMPTTPFKVIVAGHARYMDKDAEYELGSFEDLESAIAASKKLVDNYLQSAFQPGMTAEALLRGYMMFGEDPYILGPNKKTDSGPFSAVDYARQRCAEICGTPY